MALTPEMQREVRQARRQRRLREMLAATRLGAGAAVAVFALAAAGSAVHRYFDIQDRRVLSSAPAGKVLEARTVLADGRAVLELRTSAGLFVIAGTPPILGQPELTMESRADGKRYLCDTAQAGTCFALVER